MKPPEAIVILKDQSTPLELRFTSEYAKATRLGIEALKREQFNRLHQPYLTCGLLPSEC